MPMPIIASPTPSQVTCPRREADSRACCVPGAAHPSWQGAKTVRWVVFVCNADGLHQRTNWSAFLEPLTQVMNFHWLTTWPAGQLERAFCCPPAT